MAELPENISDTRVKNSEISFASLLLDQNTSYAFLSIDIILLTILFYFHYLLYMMLKREDQKKSQDFMKDLLKSYIVITPGTYLYIFAYINILTTRPEPPSHLIGHWFCDAFETVGHATIVYIGGFSVFVASMKYWFIIKYDVAMKYGESKARNVAFIAHLMIPLIMGILNSVSNGNRDQIFWIEHCWGFQGRYDTITAGNEVSEKLANVFCLNNQYEEVNNFFGTNDTTAVAATHTLRGICAGVKVFYIIFLSNGMELVIYGFVVNYLYKLVHCVNKYYSNFYASILGKHKIIMRRFKAAPILDFLGCTIRQEIKLRRNFRAKVKRRICAKEGIRFGRSCSFWTTL